MDHGRHAGNPETLTVVTTGQRYNIILIAADTTRPDHLGCYGYGRATSPNIDRLAREGALFRDFQAAQIPTHPAFTTLMTGVDPLYHGVLAHSGNYQMPPSIPMLAERLLARGYATASIDNSMTMQSAPTWFARGFQYLRAFRYRPGTGQSIQLTNWALEFLPILRSRDAPFFLFVHYFDPHTPYVPPADYRRRFYSGNELDPSDESLRAAIPPDDQISPLLLREMGYPGITDYDYVVAQYDSEIAFMDREIGRLLDGIDGQGLRENTLVAFLSDHGEAFGEGGLHFDHHTIHDAVTRCALIARLPGVISAGIDLTALVSSIDLAPTILELAGAGTIEPGTVAGRSIWPLFSGARLIRESAPIGEATRQISRGMVTKEWRLIEPIVETVDGQPVGDFRGRPRNARPRLYHRPSDPVENTDVSADHPRIVASLLELSRNREKLVESFTGIADRFRREPPSLPYHEMVQKLGRG